MNTLVALYNSKLFTYYVLNTGSSLGVEKSRINFDEFMSFPLKFVDKELGELAINISNEIDDINMIVSIKSRIDEKIKKLYNLNELEEALIDYNSNVSIPFLLREQNSSIFKPLNFKIISDKALIDTYIKVFCDSLKIRFMRINKILQPEITYSDYYLRINFNLVPYSEVQSGYRYNKVDNNILDLLMGDLGIYEVCKNLYMQQDIRGFTKSSFYIIKPNESKLWHKAVGYLDAIEFEEELVKAEISHLNLKVNARD